MNIANWIKQRAYLEPQDTILKDGPLTLSNEEFYQRVLGEVSYLRSRGVRSGDRVAVMLYNSSLFLELFFACAHVGAILVPLNYRLAGAELKYLIEDSGSSFLILDEVFREKAEPVGQDSEFKVFVNQDNRNTLYSPLGSFESSGGVMPEESVSMDTPLLIMYTSGTTGRPKGATLSHGNILWNSIMHLREGFFKEKCLANAPFFHVAGLNISALQTLYCRGSLVIEKSFNPSSTLELIEKERITCMFAAPTMMDMLARDPLFETVDFSSVRYIIAGSAPVPVMLIERFHERGVKIRQAYGLTEASPAGCILHDEHALAKQGSCGKEMFHLEIRMVDENGKDVQVGDVGEVIIKGPNVMLGYWKNPEATRETIRDGWLWTGDMGKKDEDGFIYIVDRKKDLIISGGENISPAEVESVLIEHADVAQVAVIGVPDEKWGEVPIAFVVTEPGKTPSSEEFIKFCQPRIAKYKIPAAFQFASELPRNAMGKVNKSLLKERFDTQK